MTRIVAGSARGRNLVVPRGDATRPTSDRVREAIFSRLDHEGVVSGCRVLDLFAGSGALGLEAASRGAREVWLVENAKPALTACRRNVSEVDVPGVRVVATGVERALAGEASEPFDLVLLDPPYSLGELDLVRVLRQLVSGEWMAERAVVVVERSARTDEPSWPSGLARFDERRYGETQIWFAEPWSDNEVA